MNSITFDGRLAADAELKHIPSGDAVLSFRVASDVGFGDKKTTNWFSCQIWGKRGESLAPYLLKGTPVTIYGSLTLREWTDKDGAKRLSPDVRVNELALHGKSDGQGAQANNGGQRQAQQGGYSRPAQQPQSAPPVYNEPPMDFDDDIPF